MRPEDKVYTLHWDRRRNAWFILRGGEQIGEVFRFTNGLYGGRIRGVMVHGVATQQQAMECVVREYLKRLATPKRA